MSRTCTVCNSEHRAEIDEALVRSEPLRDIARRFGLEKDAVHRHKQNGHVPGALVAVAAERHLAEGRTLLDRLEELETRARVILDASEAEGRHTVSLAALRELRGIVELLGRATGELKDGPQIAVNVLNSSDWLGVQAAILEALAPFPDARMAVATRLQALEAK